MNLGEFREKLHALLDGLTDEIIEKNYNEIEKKVYTVLKDIEDSFSCNKSKKCLELCYFPFGSDCDNSENPQFEASFQADEHHVYMFGITEFIKNEKQYPDNLNLETAIIDFCLNQAEDRFQKVLNDCMPRISCCLERMQLVGSLKTDPEDFSNVLAVSNDVQVSLKLLEKKG